MEQTKQTNISSRGPLVILVFSVLLTAAGAAALLYPRVPVVVLSSSACYGALALGYLWARRAASQVSTITADLSEAVEQVASAALQLASASQSLAQGASTQSSSLSDATGTAELMASITRQSAETGQTAVTLAGEAQQLANQSAQGLESLARTIRESNTAAGKIGGVTKVVNEIAFQTNILALNAAVEAARAGQAGAGFAVVADEVRNLAQRCAKASQEIADLAQESIARAGAGESGMEQVSGAMNALIGHTGRVKELGDEIATTSEELVRGNEGVLQEMRQVDELTRSTAASCEETAATSEQLSAQAEAMRHLVARLSQTSV
ncbi:MAG: methyl-accepting chemotaxis protein [Candidatus Solibacter sp.]|nr:methyl-accepting chemotaxis protein [Candidatus Solibacter sp.]